MLKSIRPTSNTEIKQGVWVLFSDFKSFCTLFLWTRLPALPPVPFFKVKTRRMHDSPRTHSEITCWKISNYSCQVWKSLFESILLPSVVHPLRSAIICKEQGLSKAEWPVNSGWFLTKASNSGRLSVSVLKVNWDVQVTPSLLKIHPSFFFHLSNSGSLEPNLPQGERQGSRWTGHQVTQTYGQFRITN